MSKNNKTRSGSVITLFILALEIIIISYQISGLHYETIDRVANLINDASFFMTLICLSYCYTSISKTPKFVGTALLSITDIVLINQLYSNKKLISILKWLKKLDRQIFIFGFIPLILVILGIYLMSANKKAHQDQTENNTEQTKHQNTAASYRNSKESAFKNKSTSDNNTPNKNFPINRVIQNNTVFFYLAAILGIVVCWSIIDFLIFNYLPLNISRPPFFAWVPDYLYYISILCTAFILILLLLNYSIISKMKDFAKGQGVFKMAAFIAFLLEIGILVFYEKIDSSSIMEKFLSAITDNVFTVLLAVIVLYLILHICVIVFLQFFGFGNSEIASIIQEKTTLIEERIIQITFDIILGCANLLDFMPDFFDTIGVLLLDKQEKKSIEEEHPENKECKKNKEHQ